LRLLQPKRVKQNDPKNKQTNDKVCPTCGTHLNPNARVALVCGRTFTDVPVSTNPTNKIKTRGLPQFTLSLPVALGAILILVAIGAGVIYFVAGSRADNRHAAHRYSHQPPLR
jgi:hypothetical protein